MARLTILLAMAAVVGLMAGQMAWAQDAERAEPPQRADGPGRQAGPLKVTIDEQNIIYVNGQKFLPIAVWAQPEADFGMWKDLGVNLFMTSSHPRRGGTVAEYVAAAERHQVYMSLGYRWLQSENQLQAINRHPLLFTLHHPDEPDKPAADSDAAVPRISPADILADYQAIKRLDPDRLVSLTIMARFMEEVTFKSISRQEYEAFMPATDLIMYDLYPVSIWGKNLHWNAEGLKQLRQLAGPRKPMGIWLQSSDAMNERDPGLTPVQIKANAWMSLINGATFLGYFPQTFAGGFRFHNINQARREALKAVNQQVTELAPIILTPPRTDLFKLTIAEGARVDAMQRREGNRVLLAMVNVIEEGDGRPVRVTIEPDQFVPRGAALRHDGNRRLEAADGKWTLELAPWETAVLIFETTEPAATPPAQE